MHYLHLARWPRQLPVINMRGVLLLVMASHEDAQLQNIHALTENPTRLSNRHLKEFSVAVRDCGEGGDLRNLMCYVCMLDASPPPPPPPSLQIRHACIMSPSWSLLEQEGRVLGHQAPREAWRKGRNSPPSAWPARAMQSTSSRGMTRWLVGAIVAIGRQNRGKSRERSN
jgi:hypothetical protein